MKNETHGFSKSTLNGTIKVNRRDPKHAVSYPENLLEDILRSRSLDRGLEALGYPDFMVKLYRRALHSRSVMS